MESFYRVENLDRVLEQLRAELVEIDDRIEGYDYGSFPWIMDPEGNRIELWGPLVPFARKTLDGLPAGLADSATKVIEKREVLPTHE